MTDEDLLKEATELLDQASGPSTMGIADPTARRDLRRSFARRRKALLDRLRDRLSYPERYVALDRIDTGDDVAEWLAYLGGPIHFIDVKADMVAMDVVAWMPPEDNQQHHNAVEALRRIHETCETIRATCRRVVEESVRRG